MKNENAKPDDSRGVEKNDKKRLPYEAPKVESVKLTDEAAEALT